MLCRTRFALFSGVVPKWGLFALRRVKGTGFSADTLIWPGRVVVKLHNPLMRLRHLSVPKKQRDESAFIYGPIKNRFEREYDMLQRLSGIGLSPTPIAHGSYYVAMEYVDASPLYACLDDRPHLVSRVIHAIERMHEARLHHGDLTMGNILVDSHDRIYLIDFETAFADFVPDEDRRTLDFVSLLRRLHQRHPGLAARYAADFCRQILRVYPGFAGDVEKFDRYMTDEVAADIRAVLDQRTEMETRAS